MKNKDSNQKTAPNPLEGIELSNATDGFNFKILEGASASANNAAQSLNPNPPSRANWKSLDVF